MLILGTNSDDKGKQLEKLTRNLLETLGYQNIVTNLIGPGGSEIDVRAEYSIPGLGMHKLTHKLICECKAHNKPNDSTDWLKFLGKVFCEEVRTAQTVGGCFIALNGVNGNVWGNYEELKGHRENVTLVSGVELLDLAREKYGLCDLNRVYDSVRKHTTRHYRDVEVAYYEGEVYYVVVFEDDSYTLLRSSGDVFESGCSEIIRKLVEAVMPVVEYIDLQQEAEARQREIVVKKAILSEMMVNDGTLCIGPLPSSYGDYTQEEIQSGVRQLLENEWIIEGANDRQVTFPPDTQEGFYSYMIDVYHFLVNEMVFVRVLGSTYYDRCLNEKFVYEIQKIQGEISFSEEEIQEIIQLLHWSPEAVAYATQADPRLAMRRTQDIVYQNADRLDKSDRHYFMRNLYLCLLRNFETDGMQTYFGEHRKVVELETQQTIKVKNKQGVVLEGSLRHRLRITKLADDLGGRYALVHLINDVPEPWEDVV